MKIALSAILSIICQSVWPETKEYRGVPSLAYVLQLLHSNLECSVRLDVVVAYWYMKRSCQVCVIN